LAKIFRTIMNEIKAFVRPQRLSEVVKHLRLEGFSSLSVFDGEGTGNYVDQENTWPSLKHPFLHCKISKIEIVVHSNDVD